MLGGDLASFRVQAARSDAITAEWLFRLRVLSFVRAPAGQRWFLLLLRINFPAGLNRCQPRYKLLFALHIYEEHAAFIIAPTTTYCNSRARCTLTIDAVFIARSFLLSQPRSSQLAFNCYSSFHKDFARLCRSPFYASYLISSRQAVTSAVVLLQRLQRERERERENTL